MASKIVFDYIILNRISRENSIYDGRKKQNDRNFNELRPAKITRDYLEYAEGSVLVEFGRTTYKKAG